MKINSIDLTNYNNTPSGHFILSGDGIASIMILLTKDEAHELMILALRFFEDRQQAIAKAVAEMSVPRLVAPSTPEAEFTPVDDGMSF